MEDCERFWESEYPRLGELSSSGSGLLAWKTKDCPDDGSSYLQESVPDNLDSLWVDFRRLKPQEARPSVKKLDKEILFDIAFKEGMEVTRVDEDESTDGEIADEENVQMVYSRIHGYRIPIRPEKTDEAYQRALQSLKSAGDAVTDSLVSSTSRMKKSEVKKAFRVDEKRLEQYQFESYASTVQFQPVRVSSDQAVNEPLRAILFDDLRPCLFLPSSSQEKKLLRRITELLGCRWMGSVHQRLFDPFFDTVLHFSLIHPGEDTNELHGRRDLRDFMDILSNSKKVDRVLLKRLWLPRQRLVSLDREVILGHALSSSTGQDSKLSFMIRMFQQLLGQSSPAHVDSTVAIARILVSLLCYKFEIEALRDSSPKLLKTFISQVKTLIQRVEEWNIKDKAIWCDYLVIESYYGDDKTCRKVADKLLRSVVSDRRRDDFQMIMTIVRINLQIGSVSDVEILREEDIEASLRILIDFGLRRSADAVSVTVEEIAQVLDIFQTEIREAFQGWKASMETLKAEASMETEINATRFYSSQSFVGQLANQPVRL